MTETRIRDLGAKSHLDALLATVGKVEGLRVVDIGCGEGHMARALAELGADVTGYDPFIEGTSRDRAWRRPLSSGQGKRPTPFPNRTNRPICPVYFLAPSRAGREACRRARRGAADFAAVGPPLRRRAAGQGPHQYVMELFHDETAVRKAAAEALAHFARPRFATDEIATYAEKRAMPISTALPSG